MANQFGEYIRQLRKDKNLLLKDVSAYLSMDIPMLSKIETGERKAKKSQIALFAEILNVDYRELITLWIADQIYAVIKDEEMAKTALERVSNII